MPMGFAARFTQPSSAAVCRLNGISNSQSARFSSAGLRQHSRAESAADTARASRAGRAALQRQRRLQSHFSEQLPTVSGTAPSNQAVNALGESPPDA